MIRPTVLALLAALAATPALATGGVYCDGAQHKSVGAYLTVGSAPGFPVVGAKIVTPDKAWDLNGLDGHEPVSLVQAAIVGELIVADFADADVIDIVASLRVVRTQTNDTSAAAGTLTVPGVGTWPVVCEVD